MSNPLQPLDYSPPGSSVHGILQARMLECVAIPFSRGLPYAGTEHRYPVSQADSLPSEPPGKTIISQNDLFWKFYAFSNLAQYLNPHAPNHFFHWTNLTFDKFSIN